MPATRSVVLVLVVAEQTFTWMMYSPASIANLGGGTSHEGAVRETQGSTRVKRLNPFTTKCEKNGLFVQSDTALLTLVVDCGNSAPPSYVVVVIEPLHPVPEHTLFAAPAVLPP